MIKINYENGSFVYTVDIQEKYVVSSPDLIHSLEMLRERISTDVYLRAEKEIKNIIAEPNKNKYEL